MKFSMQPANDESLVNIKLDETLFAQSPLTKCAASFTDPDELHDLNDKRNNNDSIATMKGFKNLTGQSD